MNSETVKAIVCGRIWVDKFTRYDYRKAFEEYCSLYSEAASEAAKASESPKDFAGELAGLVKEALDKEKAFKRKAANADSCMTLVAYFCPMLEKLGLKEYSDSLCEAWNKLYPKRPVSSESFETFIGGFRHSILGIDFESKH